MRFVLTHLKGVKSEARYFIAGQLYRQCSVIEQEMLPFISNGVSKHIAFKVLSLHWCNILK